MEGEQFPMGVADITGSRHRDHARLRRRERGPRVHDWQLLAKRRGRAVHTSPKNGSTSTQLPASTRAVSMSSTMKQLALTIELRIPLP